MKPHRFQIGSGIFGSFVLIVGIFLMVGCDGGGGGDGGGPVASPNIALSSNSIQFPNLVVNQTADRSVTVQNTGTATLNVGLITSPAAPFRIVTDGCSNSPLAPNGSCTVMVRFAPTTQENYLDSFNIPSNDPDQPSVPVSLSGNGQGLNVTINQLDSTGWPSITMLVTVTDADNNPIPLLPESAFTLLEKSTGTPQQMTITNFSDAVTGPVSVALDLDYSGSVTPARAVVEASAKFFLESMTNPGDRAEVVKFASTVRQMIGFTPVATGLVDLEAAIDAAYPDSPNATRLYDAVSGSVDRLGLEANIRRAAVVVSDGTDEGFTVGSPGSTATLDQVIANAQAKEVLIFSLEFGTDLKPEIMQRLAYETGGEFFPIPTATDLNTAYDKISGILGNQYEITFTTPSPDGSNNELTVGVDNGSEQGDDTVSVTY